MKLWRSFLEILQFPLKVIMLGIVLYGIGNILVNQAFSSLFVIKNEVVILFAELFMRIGSLIITYMPFIVLLRSVNRRVNGAVTTMSGFIGYISFLSMTLFFADKTLPSSAFASIFGINFTSSNILRLSGVNYPLQTGLIGALIVVFLTRISFSQSRNKSQYGFLGFIDKDTHAVILNIFYCILAGILVSLGYSYIYNNFLSEIIKFISSDITNPISLFVYGIFDRILSTFHLANLIRNPFWFQASGGTWSNIVGESIAGDVSIWTTSIASNTLQTNVGRFITPYYVLNIFAVPSMIWAIYTIYTDKFEKRRLFMFFVISTIISMIFGTLLPLELLLIILCPLLYFFHVFVSGSLFAIFQVLGISLGFNYNGTSTVVAMPGTIIELITYLRVSSLSNSIRMVVIVGVITGILYFVFTRFYFRQLAVDLFNTGTTKRLTDGILEAIGGTSNIKMINTSINKLTIQLFDSSHLDAGKLLQLGATKVIETRAGFAIQFGAASTIVGKSLRKSMRDTLKNN